MNDFTIPLTPISFSCDKYCLETLVTSKIVRNKIARRDFLQELNSADDFMRDLHSDFIKANMSKLNFRAALITIVILLLLGFMLVIKFIGINNFHMKIESFCSPIGIYMIIIAIIILAIKSFDPKSQLVINKFPFFESETFKGKNEEFVVEVHKDKIRFFFLRNPLTQHKRNQESKKEDKLRPIICESIEFSKISEVPEENLKETSRITISNSSSIFLLLPDNESYARGSRIWQFINFSFKTKSKLVGFKVKICSKIREMKARFKLRLAYLLRNIFSIFKLTADKFLKIFNLVMIFLNWCWFINNWGGELLFFSMFHLLLIIFLSVLGIHNIEDPEEEKNRSGIKMAPLLVFKACMGGLIQNSESIKGSLLTNLGPTSIRDIKLLKLFYTISHAYLNALPILLSMIGKLSFSSNTMKFYLFFIIMNSLWFISANWRIHYYSKSIILGQVHHVLIKNKNSEDTPMIKFLRNQSSLNARILRWNFVRSIESANVMMVDTKIHLSEFVLSEFEKTVNLEIQNSIEMSEFEKASITERLVRGKEEMMSNVRRCKRQSQAVEENIDDLIVTLEKEFFKIKQIFCGNSYTLSHLFENFNYFMTKRNIVNYFLYTKNLLQKNPKLTEFYRRPMCEMFFFVLIQRGIVKIYKEYEKEYVQLKTENDDEHLLKGNSPENYRKSFEEDDEQVYAQARQIAAEPQPSPFQLADESTSYDKVCQIQSCKG